VLVMATKIAQLVDAAPDVTRRAGLAAGAVGYNAHDGDKDDTNFVYHHLDSANFAAQALRDAGLSDDAEEIAAVRQAILEHMQFGDGSDKQNFMNRALVNEAAAIVAAGCSAATPDYGARLRYLMREALQKDDAAIGRVEAWLDANRQHYPTQAALADALADEFGGRELSYPRPSSEEARILSAAAIATGEHQGPDMDAVGASASDITWTADGLILASADSLPKIMSVRQVQMGLAGREPLAVSMASLAGGGFGQFGTAVDAMNALPIPQARASAQQEIELMRGFMLAWQKETFNRWTRGQTSGEIQRRRAEFDREPFAAFSVEEMLKHQPTLAEFEPAYARYLQHHADERGSLCRQPSPLRGDTQKGV